MTETEYLVDTSAWIEYFLGTALGQRVRNIMEEKGSTFYVPGVVITELVSALMRNGHDPIPCWEFLVSSATFIDTLPQDCADAGVKHAELKKTHNRISYTDALLLVLSEKRKMKIISKDEHLKGKNTIMLR